MCVRLQSPGTSYSLPKVGKADRQLEHVPENGSLRHVSTDNLTPLILDLNRLRSVALYGCGRPASGLAAGQS